MGFLDSRFTSRLKTTSDWNWQKRSRCFLRLTTRSQRCLWRLTDVAKYDSNACSDYDRVLAVFSICSGLWGQPFLREKAVFLAHIDTLKGAPRAEGVPYDKERFRQQWMNFVLSLKSRYI